MEQKVKINIKEATLLSIEEAEKFFNSDEERKCRYNGSDHPWWLRSSGLCDDYAASVSCAGSINEHGDCGYHDIEGIRPALRCEIFSQEFLNINNQHLCIEGNSYTIKKSLSDNPNEYLLVSDVAVGRRFFNRYHGKHNCDIYKDSDIERYVNRWAKRFHLIGEREVAVTEEKLPSARYDFNIPHERLMSECPDYEMFYKIGELRDICRIPKNMLGNDYQTWNDYINERIGSIDMTQNSLYKRVGLSKEQLVSLALYPSIYVKTAKYILNRHDIRDLSESQLIQLSHCDQREAYILRDFDAFYGDKSVLKVLEAKWKLNSVGDKLYDSLQMCMDCYIAEGEKVPIPKLKTPEDLERFHDTMVQLINAQSIIKTEKSTSKYQSGFDARAEKWSKWVYENDKYIVIAPKKPVDIAIEGIHLKHCVKTYIEAVYTGNTNILFIREKANPDRPFFTAEITNDGTFRQIKGFGNRNASTEPGLTEFINEWAKAKGIKIEDYNHAQIVDYVYVPEDLGDADDQGRTQAE